MCGDNNLVVNYGCCDKSVDFPDMELLFNGTANAVDTDYKLLKPVTGYKAMVVEYGTCHDGIWHKSYEFIPISDDLLFNTHMKFLHFYCNQSTFHRWLIKWLFSDNSTFYCNYVAKGENPITKESMEGTDTAILKMYGIK